MNYGGYKDYISLSGSFRQITFSVQVCHVIYLLNSDKLLFCGLQIAQVYQFIFGGPYNCTQALLILNSILIKNEYINNDNTSINTWSYISYQILRLWSIIFLLASDQQIQTFVVFSRKIINYVQHVDFTDIWGVPSDNHVL